MKQMWWSSPKVKSRCTVWPSNPTPGHRPGENHSAKWSVHSNVTAALFPTAKIWKQLLLGPSLLDEWIKMWGVWLHTPTSHTYKETVPGRWVTWPKADNLLCQNWAILDFRSPSTFILYTRFQPKVISALSSPTLTTAPFQCLPPKDDESSFSSPSLCSNTLFPISHFLIRDLSELD